MQKNRVEEIFLPKDFCILYSWLVSRNGTLLVAKIIEEGSLSGIFHAYLSMMLHAYDPSYGEDGFPTDRAEENPWFRVTRTFSSLPKKN